MADESLLEKVHDLSDLELAVLLCLINREHVLISTPSHAIDDLVQELQLVASKTFGLKWVIVNCDSTTTLEDFASALLLNQQPPTTSRSVSPYRPRADSYFTINSYNSHRPSLGGLGPLTPIPLRPKSPTSSSQRTSIVPRASSKYKPSSSFEPTGYSRAPQFKLRRNNSSLFLSWEQRAVDGYVNLEEVDGGEDDETSSTGSVVKRVPSNESPPTPALITETEISHLAKLSQKVHVDVDVLRYQMNVISFLRMHRAVACGITPAATKHFHQLVRSLAPLHELDYVTSALIGLAVKKIYLHRIRITDPGKERSMQWGSNLEAVEALLEGVGPEAVIEEVLQMVTEPF
ncbi:hypothetical protein PT974_07082 [Cladobotryum mycophilum]|uniref:Magnesium chelatase n=1 Tax=Cladobotryum mycophilum TaxID=491253 RepID=A0ABR0SP10_9HYPO